jgi:hypothetical protein
MGGGFSMQEDVMAKDKTEANPFIDQTQRHVAELMEIVEQCREDARGRAEHGDAVGAAKINQTRVMALSEIHAAKMGLLGMQQRQAEIEMMESMRGLVVPA